MSQDNTPTESMVGFDGDGIPDLKTHPASRQHTDQHEDTTRLTFSERLRAIHYIEPILPKPDDLAYMAPERVEEMLRRCNHVCRTNGCGQVVERCGQHCDDCQGEIDAWRKKSEDITASGKRAFSSALWTVLPAVIGLIGVVFLLKWWWEASK